MKKINFLVLAFFLSLIMNAQIITFPDVNFKSKLLAATSSNQIAKNLAGTYFKIDSNNDGEIQNTEAEQVSYLNLICVSCSNVQRITSLEGIHSFTNLAFLITKDNNLINYDYEVTNNSVVQELDLRDNFKSIKVQNTSNLTFLRFSDGYNPNGDVLIDNAPQLTTNFGIVFLVPLNISGNFTLRNCSQIEKLQFTINTSGVRIDSLFIENLPNLNHVFLQGNSTGSNTSFPYTVNNLSIKNTPLLNSLSITETNIQDLDLYQLDSSLQNFTSNGNKNLINLGVVGLPLTAFTLLNNHNSLYKICVDDSNFDLVKAEVLENGSTSFVTPYCTFLPNDFFYLINGVNTFDATSNGCDTGDFAFPYQNFSISDGTVSGSFIANNSGAFSFPVIEGTYTIAPVLENPTYFTISPPNLTINFPEETSPFLQNFCITPNGIHNDLEITLVPLGPARPGFDANYKIVYKNKGNSVLSGAVTFEFEDAKMDLISSIPNFSTQATGILTYDYLNLQPFETREILLTMNINSPQETPPVIIGNQLNFTAIINPISGDEIPLDNTSSLKQIVVGSFDPNDKTCIEGNTVGPEIIGQYVHYVIRFENTGTFPAENVVVKDMIDLTKFDLSSLIPTSSSHSFVTRIAADGKVEFIFENIQLPFDDANNDGYIAFKIKTLPSLVVGDTFSNSANIYFDYNFPIVTNTTSTTIQVLENADFNFGEFLTIYPNPTQNSLNIKMNSDISISSLNIYNSLGQLVLVTTNPSESIDVSSLKTGSYFVKVISDKGISTIQFVKE